MRRPANGRDVGATGGEAPGAATAEGGRAGAPPRARIVDAPLVLPCPLRVLSTTHESETGRPLSDLLRRIGYL